MKRILTLLVFCICCEYGKAQSCLEANIIILNDKSTSMKNSEFSACYLIQNLLFNLPINKDHVWVGLAGFGNQLDIFPPSSDSEDVVRFAYGLCESEATDSVTSLTSGEILTLPVYLHKANLARGKNVQNIVIIISDGHIGRLPTVRKYMEVLREEYSIEVFAVALQTNLEGSLKLLSCVGDLDHYAYGDTDKALSMILASDECR